MIPRRIGIFGGSFNPIHNGHLNICNAFLMSGSIDELWVIPVFDPPHKSSDDLLSFDDRFEMTKIAFQSFSSVKILDIEKLLPKPNYTLQTLQYLKEQNDDASFILCIGSDSLTYFHTWYNYKSILDITTLLVAKRAGYVYTKIETEILNKVVFVDSSIFPESSTAIREEIKIKGFSNQIPSEVMYYIKKHNLFSSVTD
jgi:nicotinate-nucleotide adenylyltransferase